MSTSTQDEGHDTSTPHQQPGEYRKRPHTADQDGTDFEIKMCALVYLRAVQSYSSFTMRSNYEPAGGFDDIVFSYGSPENEQNILIQLKTSNKTITFSPKGKYALQKYLESLKKEKTSESFKNCSYVFFTNADVKSKPRVANVHSPAKTLLCTTWKPNDICQVHLTDNICEDFRDDTGAEDFVNRLLIFRNQSGPKYLDEFIKQELIKMCNGYVPQCQAILKIFVEKIKVWWGKERKLPLDENWEEWTELKAQLFGQNTLLKQITFCEDTLSNLEKSVLNSKSDIILFKSDSAESQIACSKVYQTFVRKEYLRVLFTDIFEPPESLDMLLSLWSKDVYDVLVITDVANRRQNLGDNIANYKGNLENHNNKKIVIMSSAVPEILGLEQDLVEENDTELIKSTFNQLDDNSKGILQNLPVHFQGKEIILGRIMADKILEGGLLQYVLTSPNIQIGEALPARDEKYIPRTLSKRLVVNKSILNSNGMFFLCGIKEEDLKLLTAQAKGEESLDEEWYRKQKHRFNIKSRKELDEAMSGFKCCANKLSENPVYYLEVIDGSLHWMHSHGSTDNLFKYIRRYPREEDDCRKFIKDVGSWQAKEEDLVREKFQTVIVASEPGSGKPALLREVASKMKELYPHRWIINIDLNKHSEILKKIKLGKVTEENVLELLSKAANLDDSELGKELLKYNVLESGDISILFDAFDEIAPSYTETVLAILKFILSKFRLSTLWVASRYNVKERLEIELESKVFRIDPLSYQEQIKFMSKLWGREKAESFLTIVLDEIRSQDVIAVSSFPLHLKMICEVCHDLVMSDNISRPSMLFNITNLYEKFIETKLNIYFKDKVPLNDSSAQIGIVKEELRKRFMKRHMICSLVVLDIVEEIDKSCQSSIMKKAQEICQDIAEGKEILGIIDGVVEGKPHFLHRTFAEYFAGKWLAKHWEKNKQLIEKSFFVRRLEIVYKAFCQELARGLPTHVAVLNGDVNALEGLKDGLNKTDVLGRTPLHLAAQSRDKGANGVVLKLMEYGPNLEMIDDLLGLTPLYYAAEAESWALVRILVERGARLTRDIPYHLHEREEFVEAIANAGRRRK